MPPGNFIGNFIITSFVQIAPTLVQVTGHGIGSLTTLTVMEFPTTGSPPINPNIQPGVIFASPADYTNLCNCLNNMGSGTVQLTTTYTFVNGLIIVSAISCVNLPSEIHAINTLTLQNAAALQAISESLIRLTMLVTEALQIPGPLVNDTGNRALRQSGFASRLEEEGSEEDVA